VHRQSLAAAQPEFAEAGDDMRDGLKQKVALLSSLGPTLTRQFLAKARSITGYPQEWKPKEERLREAE
jgi:hypothetical protein